MTPAFNKAEMYSALPQPPILVLRVTSDTVLTHNSNITEALIEK